MTNEEARQWFLKVYSEIKGQGYADENEEAYELAIKALEQEPCEDNRLYIKVYADLEPQEKAEKLYQICGKDELKEVYKELGEYCEIEPCDDAISRNDMLDAVGHGTTYTSLEVQKIINGLPSVNPVPCDDVISRQAVLDCATLITSIPTEDWDIGDWVCLFRDRVSQLQSVRPQEQTGHWIEIAQYSDEKHKIECSECGNHIFDKGHANSFNVKNKYKYCPNCGVRMGVNE